MKRDFKHEMLIKGIKVLNVVFMAFVFGMVLCNTHYGKDFLMRDERMIYILCLLFAVIYALIGKVYDAFYISIKRISEIIYSQCLSVLITDAIIYIIVTLVVWKILSVKPFVLMLVAQLIIAFIWGYFSHIWYFKVFPARKSAVVYDCRIGFEKLIEEYGLSDKYSIEKLIKSEDCIKDLDVLADVKTVFLSGIHSKERNIILKYCIAKDIQVFVIPRIGDMLMSGAKAIHMFHLPMLQVERNNVSFEYLFAKRVVDILVSLVGIVVTSPIMLIVAIAIKLYDGGPVIYSHIRLTKDGKEFPIYKFRSMKTDAEKDGVARLSTGEKDSRITPVGSVIRKLRLDELPQLLNILKGDLSLVGPRPERPEIAKQYEVDLPEFALRLRVKAGLTGYAQVYGKYNTTPYDKLQLDLMYIAHQSIVEDLKILMATVKILFMPESTEGVEEGKTTAEN